MKLYLIELIHNIDMICNILFCATTAVFTLEHIKTPRGVMYFHRWVRIIWLCSIWGVLLIPPKEVLQQIIMSF